MKKITEEIVNKLKEKAGERHDFVVNISGGIDSSVAAKLCDLTGIRTHYLILPCESTESEIDRAKELCSTSETMGCTVIDLKPTFDQLVKDITKTWSDDTDKLSLGNLKARLRMSTAYFYSNNYNSLVIGTDNYVESYLGYFTRYGDGGHDINPLGDLYKSEVFELGKYLGVPKSILRAPPSAGLWEGQTDEDEMGMTYDEIETAMKWLESDEWTYSIDSFDKVLDNEITDSLITIDNLCDKNGLEFFYIKELIDLNTSWKGLTDREREVILKVKTLNEKNSFKGNLPQSVYLRHLID